MAHWMPQMNHPLRFLVRSTLPVLLIVTAATSDAAPKDAGKPKQPAAGEVRALQLEATKFVIEAVTSLRPYVESFRGKGEDAKPTREYPADAMEKYSAGIGRIQKALACCKSQVDPELVKYADPKTVESFQKMFGKAEDIITQVRARGIDFVGPGSFLLQLAKIDMDLAAKRIATTYFERVWKVGNGTFTMSAHIDRDWAEKLKKANLGEHVALVIDMNNATAGDFKFNPMGQKFVIMTSGGDQVESVDPVVEMGKKAAAKLAAAQKQGEDDPEEALQRIQSAGESGLEPADQKSLYGNEIRTLFAGGKASIVVLFPNTLPAPETLRQVVYESELGGNVRERLLPSGVLTRKN
jgi:hypothetical protein